MPRDKNQPVTHKELEKLLVQQTAVILNAVDNKMEKMEFRINQKIESLTKTLDRFLKRMTDMEDEFKMMKADINRMKKVIKEKLGVELN